MKKGLRHRRAIRSPDSLGQNDFPDEEGIKTSPPCSCLAYRGQNDFPDEEGIKTWFCGRCCEHLVCQNDFPDEEGIKTNHCGLGGGYDRSERLP